MVRSAPPWAHGPALLREIAGTNPAGGSLAFWHIGQSGFFMRGDGQTLLFDPFLMPSGGRLQRRWEPPVVPGDVAGVDVVLCSHDHLDHLDDRSLPALAAAAPQAVFVVPPAAVTKMQAIGIDPNRVLAGKVDETIEVGSAKVLTVPAAHGDRADPIAECVWEPDASRGYRFVGFVVDCNGVRVYHAGDTTIYPGMVERLQGLKIDVALLPINGRDWFREQRQIIGNCDHREAADLGHAIGASVIVPIHYDMFAGNPGHPGWFVDYCQDVYPEQAIHVPARCRRWTYVKGG